MNHSTMLFNAVYQNRLRRYVIREPNAYIEDRPGFEPIPAGNDPAHLFKNLPQNQFGGCLVYNFFHYKKPSLIKTYLDSIFQILGPGGRLLCTINDCDRWQAAMNAQSNTQSFTPLSWFLEQCSAVGYVQPHHHHLSPSVTWVELTKPGHVDLIKAGQTLAKIHNKPTDSGGTPIYWFNDKRYNKQEIENLIEAAVNLNIDTAYNCRYLYTPQQLAKLIKRRMKQT